jgi:succinoglycan biosynthesis transport protein ExoP
MNTDQSVSDPSKSTGPRQGEGKARSGYYDYGGSSHDEAEGGEIGLGQLIAIIGRQWKLLAAISIGTLILMVAIALMLTPTYSATAVIKIDPSSKPLVSGNQSVQQAAEDQSVLGTETGIIQSRTIARQVIDALKLDTMKEFAPKHPERMASKEAIRETVADAFLKKLTVKRDADNYLININFSAKDRNLAATISNAIADAYVASSVTQRQQIAATQAQWLNERLDKLTVEVQSAESMAAQYKARAGIVQNTTQGTVTDQQVGPMVSALTQAEQEEQATKAELATAREQIARGNLGSISGVLSSQVITDLRRQRAESSKELADVQTRYGPKHPDYQRVRETINNLDRAINEETNRIIEGLKAKAQSAASQAAALRGNLNRVKSEQSSNAKSAAYADSYDRDAKAKQTTYEELAHKLEQASQAQHDQVATALIVERAVAPVLPTFPNIPRFAALGLVLGMLIGFVTIFIRDMSNASIRFVEDLGKASGAKVIVSVPALTKKDLKLAGESAVPADLILRRPISAYAEAFRTLRSSIMLSGSSVPKVIAIMSALPEDGKSTVSTSLAQIMATNNDRVLLIDCDLRRGQIAKLTKVTPKTGLVEVLTGQDHWRDAIVRHEESPLDVLPVSYKNFTTADLFGSSAMQDLMRELRNHYDFIILDTPPLLAVADARMIASLSSDTTIFVGASNKTPRRAVQSAIEMLHVDHSPLLGTVLTMVDRSTRKASRKDPSYYYEEYSHYVEAQ